jgi:hypothetical protein
MFRSETRKIDRTPDEQARIDAIRAHFQRDRPTHEELIASGEFEGPIAAGVCGAVLWITCIVESSCLPSSDSTSEIHAWGRAIGCLSGVSRDDARRVSIHTA